MRPNARGFAALLAVVTFVGTTAARAETIQVVIDKLTFSPATVTARVGDTIEWVNRDALAHTATVRDDWEVIIPPKQTNSLIITKAGTVEYYCRYHPNMKGRIDIPVR